MIQQTIGFIGAGQMARALARGFVSAGLVSPERIVASDPSSAARDGFVATVPGARPIEDNAQAAGEAEVLFLAIKPQQMDAALETIAPAIGSRHLVVSIAAGVPLSRIRAPLGAAPRLVRVMPNTPAMVGQATSGYCLSENATDTDDRLVAGLLGAVGRVFRLDESLLDAVTGLAGSGPAFVYEVIDALAEGGVRMGLPGEIAIEMAVQTVRGAAAMILETGESTATLRDRVTSPGGTTLAGLEAMRKHRLSEALIAAVEAATHRSRELRGIE